MDRQWGTVDTAGAGHATIGVEQDERFGSGAIPGAVAAFAEEPRLRARHRHARLSRPGWRWRERCWFCTKNHGGKKPRLSSSEPVRPQLGNRCHHAGSKAGQTTI